MQGSEKLAIYDIQDQEKQAKTQLYQSPWPRLPSDYITILKVI
jgi:hypothetical protein